MQAEQRRQEAIEHNRGVYIAATFAAAPLPAAAAAAARGIRRAADKIVLPAHLSDELMKQEAHAQGLSFWRISARDGRSTAASALEFSAPEGMVLLPRKVAQSLWGVDVRTHAAAVVSVFQLTSTRMLLPHKFRAVALARRRARPPAAALYSFGL
jgi:ubiquitin fusion degradation protein 1